MSNFERDVANAMLDKADERNRELEALLRRGLNGKWEKPGKGLRADIEAALTVASDAGDANG